MMTDDPAMHALRGRFIDAMRHAAASVAVVTTDGPAGRWGLTVSAVCSVSADPPMILVCINQRSPVLPAIIANSCFCVNFLSVNQSYVADVFAGRRLPARDDRFSTGTWRNSATGAPELIDAVAALDCRLKSESRVASHAILVGQTVETRVEPGEPLIYLDRSYRRMGNTLAQETRATL
jgi:flavin reductase